MCTQEGIDCCKRNFHFSLLIMRTNDMEDGVNYYYSFFLLFFHSFIYLFILFFNYFYSRYNCIIIPFHHYFSPPSSRKEGQSQGRQKGWPACGRSDTRCPALHSVFVVGVVAPRQPRFGHGAGHVAVCRRQSRGRRWGQLLFSP